MEAAAREAGMAPSPALVLEAAFPYTSIQTSHSSGSEEEVEGASGPAGAEAPLGEVSREGLGCVLSVLRACTSSECMASAFMPTCGASLLGQIILVFLTCCRTSCCQHLLLHALRLRLGRQPTTAAPQRCSGCPPTSRQPQRPRQCLALRRPQPRAPRAAALLPWERGSRQLQSPSLLAPHWLGRRRGLLGRPPLGSPLRLALPPQMLPPRHSCLGAGLQLWRGQRSSRSRRRRKRSSLPAAARLGGRQPALLRLLQLQQRLLQQQAWWPAPWPSRGWCPTLRPCWRCPRWRQSRLQRSPALLARLGQRSPAARSSRPAWQSWLPPVQPPGSTAQRGRRAACGRGSGPCPRPSRARRALRAGQPLLARPPPLPAVPGRATQGSLQPPALWRPQLELRQWQWCHLRLGRRMPSRWRRRQQLRPAQQGQRGAQLLPAAAPLRWRPLQVELQPAHRALQPASSSPLVLARAPLPRRWQQGRRPAAARPLLWPPPLP